MAGRVALYGATGYTGRLVAVELRRRGIETTLAGRNAEKLRRLAADLAVDWPVRAAAVDDATGLRAALSGADAVINCAGPFTTLGVPVIEAALEVGAHYLDTTGEQPYMHRVFTTLDAPARRAGRAVIPAMGFDYVPGDLVAALAAEGRGPLEEIAIAYSVKGGGMTRGTMHSVVEILAGGDLEYRDGAWHPSGRPPLGETFDFPAPVGTQPVARYPGGEVVTVPRHVQTRAVRQRINARGFAPHPALARAVPAVLPVLGLLLRTPVRRALDAAIDRLPEGPSEEVRRAARWMVVADARGEDGRTRRVTAVGPDMYGITAVMAVHGAELLTDEDYDRSGALAPAQAFDAEAVLRHLEPHGVRFEIAGAARERAATQA